jgi:hypothetical protein
MPSEPASAPPRRRPPRARAARARASLAAVSRGLAAAAVLLLAGLAHADPPKGPPRAPGGAEPAKPAPAPLPREKDDPYPPAFRQRVNKAVEDGVAALFAAQRPDGSWVTPDKETQGYPLGVTALMTLACLMGGTPGDDPRIEKAFGYLRTLPLEKTYSVSVLLMALHAKYAGAEDMFAQDGTDAYGNPVNKDPCLSKMNPVDKEWMERAVEYLLKHQRNGNWRYPEQGTDLSNTQYALLGLWAASRCGAKIPQEAWFAALEWLLASQERTGPEATLRLTEARGDYRIVVTERARARGFKYIPGRPDYVPTGAMTSAGLAGLVICQDELWASRRFTAEQRNRTRKGVRDAMAWLQENFDVTRNPGQVGGGWHLYYLYGLERAGILARTRFIGTKDWYLEGATWLLGRQESDGTWRVEHKLLDTAFAVLFLKRSAMKARQRAITPSEEAPKEPAPAR